VLVEKPIATRSAQGGELTELATRMAREALLVGPLFMYNATARCRSTTPIRRARSDMRK
jgi:hypothetical protein